jgi:short-subunit dehydrogenase
VDWQDAVVVVTGGSSGIGLEVGRLAAQRGAHVGLVARSHDALEAAHADLGGRGAFVAADVGDPDAAHAAIARLRAELGPIDVLVCSAGVGAFGAFASAEPGLAERLVRTNLLGAMHTTRAVLGEMLERSTGHVVYVGSIAGHVGVPYEATYSATKFGLAGFAEALAIEVASRGVGVSVVSPGPVDTGFFAARGHPYTRRRPRPLPPEVVARAVVSAVDSRRAEVLVPRSLRAAVLVRAIAPSLYRWGARRAVPEPPAG